ncbi:DUF1045 domain-containing protein [Novispirillum itersonii]|uniref:DUF1045 domain-containing protein n=1 Tax=Novispirillum itersonii TaxID=189 RepID=UPI00036FA1A1|nr:DUF1045 domain-containing protein [Novispirillum itersonii]
MTARYALYYAPPAGSDLERTAARWLGRGVDGTPHDQPELAGLSAEEIRALTAAPRFYGFHATLKAPFELADGSDEDGLLKAAGTLMAGQAAFDLPPLAVTRLGGFLALIPQQPSAALQAFAGRCVTELDRFRRPETPEQQASRRAKGLTPAEDAHLTRWGYPYVLDTFRFHMTLTGPLSGLLNGQGDRTAALTRDLAALFSGCGLERLRLTEVAIYRQPDRDQPFTLWRRMPAGG